MQMQLRTRQPCTPTAKPWTDSLPRVPSLFQNSRKLSRPIIVIWSEMKYVPSQIITATLSITVLCPAAFWEREVLKEAIVATKAEGIENTISWSLPHRANSMSRWALCCSHSCCHQPSGTSGVSHAPEFQRKSPTSTQLWGHAVAIATHNGKPF